MRYKDILFDVDGTLIDTEYAVLQANSSMSRMGNLFIKHELFAVFL